MRKKPKNRLAERFADKRNIYGQLRMYAHQHSYKEGWAANKYRDIYGVWPANDMKHTPHAIVCADLATWIKSTQIRWAKRRRAETAQPVTGVI